MGYLWHALKDKGVIDSGCSRHVTGNMSYLIDFKEINGGYVAFGGNPKDEKITDTECIVLSPEFKLPDENQVLLRVPRENNMYNVDLKNIVLSGDLTCLFAKETLDEVLVTKPHNKTPYELLLGRTPSICFMRPFGCHVTILNTLDPLGKFDRKVDEGFLVGYSAINLTLVQVSKNNLMKKTREENVQQYVLFSLWSTGSKDPQNTDDDATFEVKETEFEVEKLESEVHVFPSSSAKTKKYDDKTKREAKGNSPIKLLTGYKNLSEEFEDLSDNNINEVNAASTPVPAVGQISTNSINTFSVAGPSNTADSSTHGKSSYVNPSQYHDDPNIPALEDITYSDDEEDVGAEADFSSLETPITVSPIPTTRVHKDHHVTQIIGDLSSATQTRSMTRMVKDQDGLTQIKNEDFHACMFACFLSQKEPKRVHQALKDPNWIEAMQEELLQFKIKKVWVLVDLPNGKRAIGHTQEGSIDYEEVFTPVARIEAIRLFLAYATFMGFMVYQMDVKSAFLYGTIKEEVYVCQPPGFEDPDYPDKTKIEQYFLMTDYSLWERLARKNELKACGTLLMALPDNHQLKFNIHKDAKTLMEAIEKRFGGNKETKKVQKTLLKQQYENFTGSSSESLDQIYDRLQKLIKQLEIFGESLTNESISVVFSVSAASAKVFVSALPNVDTLSDVVIYSFFASQSNSPQLDNDDLKQIDKTDRNLGANETTSIGSNKLKVKCYNCHMRGHFIRECMSPKDTRRNVPVEPQRRNVPVETLTSNALASQTNDKTGLGNDNQVFTSSMFDCNEMFSSESDVSMHASPIYNRYQSGEGYHVVPPPYTRTFMPPKPDLVFHDAPTMNEIVPTAFNVELIPTKPDKDLSQYNRPTTPIIKDWVSDSEDEYEVQTPVRNHAQRRNHQHYARMTHPNPQRHVVPTAVLTRSKLVSLTAARPVTTVVPHNNVIRPRPAKTVGTKPHSPPRRTINHRPSPPTSNFLPKVTTVKAPKVNAVKGVQGNWVSIYTLNEVYIWELKRFTYVDIRSGAAPTNFNTKNNGSDAIKPPLVLLVMSNITGDDGSFSSREEGQEKQIQELENHFHGENLINVSASLPPPPPKKKRNLPGTPDPTADVIALSPTTLMATNRFVCEICNKGFQRDQNLQLHRRGHNLPWKLRQRTSTEMTKRVYVCPEPSCVHHNPARALGDLTGIKKHFSRKHGEKKWKCDKCSKKYAVQSDWKAHQKTCGTREYKCDCGTIFSRRDSFITHRAFCDALAEENKMSQEVLQSQHMDDQLVSSKLLDSKNNGLMGLPNFNNYENQNSVKFLPQELAQMSFKPSNMSGGMFSSSSGTLFGNPKVGSSSSSGLQLSSPNGSAPYGCFQQDNKDGGLLAAHMSATALLQKAAQMGATVSNGINSPMMQKSFITSMAGPDHLNSPRPMPTSPYGLQRVSPYDNFQGPLTQTTIAGINVPSEGYNPVMNDIGSYSQTLTGGDQINVFAKNVEDHIDIGDDNSNLIDGRSNSSIWRTSKKLRIGGNDTLTVDFLGVGGSRPLNIQEQQQRFSGFEATSHVMNPFHQLVHGESSNHETHLG
uniref:Protein indeterminate-domain 2-like n=1 Tax=Tanacetum cinerariifolium TaxID=118510 RepID=A0A6L2MW93_TANCI|nr:protein indeterminate-domain 2-like [Tanacetum cinerariifolium]